MVILGVRKWTERPNVLDNYCGDAELELRNLREPKRSHGPQPVESLSKCARSSSHERAESSYPDGISQRILVDTTAEILVPAAAHGALNLHRIVHDETLPSDGALTCDNHKASMRCAG
jgi:hypothetical protein